MVRIRKVEIKPNPAQAQLIRQWCGARRWFFNHAVDIVLPIRNHNQQVHKAGVGSFIPYPSGMTIVKQVNHETGLPVWTKDIPYKVRANAMLDAGKALGNYRTGSGFPRFKAKGKSRESFRIEGAIHVDRHRIKLPKIGWIPLKEYGYLLQDEGITSATVSIDGNRYWVSVNLRGTEPVSNHIPKGQGEGLDWGVKTTMVSSTGWTHPNINKTPKVRKLEKTIKLTQKRLARQEKGSARRDRTLLRLQNLNYRLRCVREADRIALAQEVVNREPKFIAIENLNIKGMLRNRHISKAVQDSSPFAIRQTITQAARKRNIEVRLVDRWYPSSKICSHCGSQQPMPLKQRIYVCQACGMVKDRDLNAAENLAVAPKYKVVT